jgi:hypothetical protein
MKGVQSISGWSAKEVFQWKISVFQPPDKNYKAKKM